MGRGLRECRPHHLGRAYLAWTLMAAEVLFVAARDNDMPRFLRLASAADVPVPALFMSTLLSQLFLIVTLFSEVRASLRARPDQCAYADPVPARRGVRGEGGPRPYVRCRARHDQSTLVVGLVATVYIALPALRGRTEVRARLVHHLRTRDDPLRHRATRAGPARLLAGGTRALRHLHRWRRPRHRRARQREWISL